MPSITGSTIVRPSGAIRIMAPMYGHQDSVDPMPSSTPVV